MQAAQGVLPGRGPPCPHNQSIQGYGEGLRRVEAARCFYRLTDDGNVALLQLQAISDMARSALKGSACL